MEFVFPAVLVLGCILEVAALILDRKVTKHFSVLDTKDVAKKRRTAQRLFWAGFVITGIGAIGSLIALI